MPNPLARPFAALESTAEKSPDAGPQLPRFLWGVEDDEEDDSPAYRAVPLDQVPKQSNASLSLTSGSTTDTISDTLSALSLRKDRASALSSPAPSSVGNDETSHHENAERDSPVIGTSGNKISDVTQTPVFAQLRAAQAGTGNAHSSSVYTFGRRLATCKFFRPTKGYGFLNDIKPSELGFQDVMVHATELYGPRNARIQSLARGELVEYTLVWAQHRGFYAVSVTGPGAVPVIGDAACNNGSIAYGRVSGPSAATARPPMTLAAAAQAPILHGELRPLPLNTEALNPPRYDSKDVGPAIESSNSPISPSFGSLSPSFGVGSFRGSPLPSPNSNTFPSSTPPLPSPHYNHGWPAKFGSIPAAHDHNSAATTTQPKSVLPSVETLMEQNQQLMRRLALLEGRSGAPSPASHSAATAGAPQPQSIWAPLPRP